MWVAPLFLGHHLIELLNVHSTKKDQIEEKCPYSKKDVLSLGDAVTDISFFLDSDKSLKRNHKYFYQVQFWLHVGDFQKCDFIVWTPNWLHIFKIERDDIFIANTLLVVEKVCMKNILSELLTRKLETFEKKKFDGENEKHYCSCKNIYNEDETWIGCDSDTCKWEWFHLTCFNLKRVPKGNWYCPVRRKKGSEKKIAKRKRWHRSIHNCHTIIYSPKFIPLTHICAMFGPPENISKP